MTKNEIETLIQLLARLPGLGPRSARRAALHLIAKREQLLLPLAAALQRTGEAIRTCSRCGNIDTVDPCGICGDARRQPGVICVVEEVILALSATVDGQTTAHVVAERLASSGVSVTRLAHGVPVGGELDYLDDGTLTAALKARRPA